MTFEDLLKYLRRYTHNNFKLYIDDTPITEDMLGVDTIENKLSISVYRRNIGKSCNFEWKGVPRTGKIIDYALGNYIISAKGTIVAVNPDKVLIKQNSK